jgi:hypothetical protein
MLSKFATTKEQKVEMLDQKGVDSFDFRPFEGCFEKRKTFTKGGYHILSQEAIKTFEGETYFMVQNIRTVSFKSLIVKKNGYDCKILDCLFELDQKDGTRHLSKGAIIFCGWSSCEKGKFHFFIPSNVQYYFLSGGFPQPYLEDLIDAHYHMSRIFREWEEKVARQIEVDLHSALMSSLRNNKSCQT